MQVALTLLAAAVAEIPSAPLVARVPPRALTRLLINEKTDTSLRRT